MRSHHVVRNACLPGDAHTTLHIFHELSIDAGMSVQLARREKGMGGRKGDGPFGPAPCWAQFWALAHLGPFWPWPFWAPFWPWPIWTLLDPILGSGPFEPFCGPFWTQFWPWPIWIQPWPWHIWADFWDHMAPPSISHISKIFKIGPRINNSARNLFRMIPHASITHFQQFSAKFCARIRQNSPTIHEDPFISMP